MHGDLLDAEYEEVCSEQGGLYPSCVQESDQVGVPSSRGHQSINSFHACGHEVSSYSLFKELLQKVYVK